jgi:alkylhydroperoxidase family enzyme
MAWIDTIPEDEATGRLARIYAGLVEPWGGVDNILKIHSLNPPSLTAHARLYETLMRGESELSEIDRERIAVVVSAANRCHY